MWSKKRTRQTYELQSILESIENERLMRQSCGSCLDLSELTPNFVEVFLRQWQIFFLRILVVSALPNKLVAPAQQSVDGVAGIEPSKKGRHGNKDETASEHVMPSIWFAYIVVISMLKTIKGPKRVTFFFADILMFLWSFRDGFGTNRLLNL